MKRSSVLPILALFAPSCLVAQTANGRPNDTPMLYGTVRAGSLNKPNPPLAGAGVEVYRVKDSQYIDGTTTEGNGTYELRGLIASETYSVTYCKAWYSPGIVVTVPKKVDQTLTQEGLVYWNSKKNDVLTAFYAAGRSDQVAFGKTWETFEMSPISAEGKAYVAHELTVDLKPELWGNMESFKAYADADPAKLDKAEHSIWLNTGDPVIYSLNPMIVKDMRVGWSKIQPVSSSQERPSSRPCTRAFQ